MFWFWLGGGGDWSGGRGAPTINVLLFVVAIIYPHVPVLVRGWGVSGGGVWGEGYLGREEGRAALTINVLLFVGAVVVDPAVTVLGRLSQCRSVLLTVVGDSLLL